MQASEVGKIEGLEDVQAILNKIPYTVATKLVKGALVAGAEPIVEAVRSHAPVASKPSHLESRPAELRESIGMAVHLGKNLDDNFVDVGPEYDKGRFSGPNRTHSPGVYGLFVERGTHNMAAEPFMRPGYSDSSDAAIEAVANYFIENIEVLKD